MKRIVALLFLVALLILMGAYVLVPGGPLSTEARWARQVEPWEERLSPHLIEWQDLIGVANSTSRMALSPLIRDMQRVRREAMAIEPPECAIVVYSSLSVSMDAEIDAFLSFMAQEPSSAVGNDMAMAVESGRRFWRELQDLKQVPPDALERWPQALAKRAASLIPVSDLPRDTYINGYDPESGERLAAVYIIDHDGAVVAHLDHGNPITVTKIDGANCFVTTETGVKGLVACAFIQMPEP